MKMKKITLILITLIIIGLFQIVINKEKFPENSISLSQGSLVYNEFNSNSDKIIIMLHGSPGSKKDFKLLAPQIQGYKIYALDMYGFGESEKYVNNYGIKEQALVLEEFMNKKGIDKATILGYSWGGGVALEFAGQFPEKTERLILLDSMGIQEGEATRTYFGEHIRYMISYPFVVFYPGAFLGSEGWRHGFMKSFMDSDQREIRTLLEKIQAKTLILHGNKDSVIEPWVAEEHHKLIKNSKLVWFNGGHGTIFSNTDEISQKVQEFLDNE